MKIPIFPALFVSALLLAGCHIPCTTRSASASTINVTGQWHWVCCGGKYQGEFTLQQDAGKITGRLFDENDTVGGALDGSVKGNTVQFTRNWADNLRQDYILNLSDDGKKLEGKFDGTQDETAGNHFEATRK